MDLVELWQQVGTEAINKIPATTSKTVPRVEAATLRGRKASGPRSVDFETDEGAPWNTTCQTSNVTQLIVAADADRPVRMNGVGTAVSGPKGSMLDVLTTPKS